MKRAIDIFLAFVIAYCLLNLGFWVAKQDNASPDALKYGHRTIPMQSWPEDK